MKIHDITRPVGVGIRVWPGDTPFALDVMARLADGDPVNLSRITMSPHTGTHTDAPLHVADGGGDVASLRLDAYVGPCVVADVRGFDGGVRPEDLPAETVAALGDAPRLLLRTRTRTRTHTRGDGPDAAAEDRAFVSPSLAAWLVSRGVLLVGLDTSSVDAPGSSDLDAHRILLGAGLAVLESLDLSAIPAATYELFAAPLRLVGADGSPVRALLVER